MAFCAALLGGLFIFVALDRSMPRTDLGLILHQQPLVYALMDVSVRVSVCVREWGMHLHTCCSVLDFKS
jgi:hypothetical protein